jgi:hypothetical protein
MRSQFSSPAGSALAFALAVALAGCAGSPSSANGVASKTPAQILAVARSAAAGAATVHVKGSIVSDGKPISIDMELVADKGGAGRITLAGRSIELIDLDRTVYINANAAFYSRFAGPTAARLLRGRWLKGPAERGAFASLASLADLGKLIDSTLAGHGTLSHAGATTVNGQKAVGVSDVAKGGTLYVSTVGAPYPIEIVKDGADGTGKLVFDRWNKPVTLEAPANAIDIDQLPSGR